LKKGIIHQNKKTDPENEAQNEKTEETEYIRIVWVDIQSEKAQKMIDEEGVAADIGFRFKTLRGKPLTEIRIISNTAKAELLAHEFGHFIQYLLEEKGFEFEHEEEISFLLEDTIKNLLRKKLYNLK
jgi:hypothetical protein